MFMGADWLCKGLPSSPCAGNLRQREPDLEFLPGQMSAASCRTYVCKDAASFEGNQGGIVAPNRHLLAAVGTSAMSRPFL